MSKRFGITDDTIYCVNNDGSVTNIAVIDIEDGDVRPIDNDLWYSEIEDRLEELSSIKEDYSKLVSLVSKTNKQIISAKSAIFSLENVFKDGLIQNIFRLRYRWGIITFFVLLFILSSFITIIGDLGIEINILTDLYSVRIAHTVLIILSAISIIAVVAFFANICHVRNIMQSVKTEADNLAAILCNDKKVYDFANELNLTTLPLIITDVQIGNTDYDGNVQTPYGNSISENDTMYLKPKVKYFGIKSGVQTLRIRWIKPDGSISKGNSSVGDFSQISGYKITSGQRDEICLSGWGGTNKGHWKAGQYFIEIWHDDIRLIRKSFTIY